MCDACERFSSPLTTNKCVQTLWVYFIDRSVGQWTSSDRIRRHNCCCFFFLRECEHHKSVMYLWQSDFVGWTKPWIQCVCWTRMITASERRQQQQQKKYVKRKSYISVSHRRHTHTEYICNVRYCDWWILSEQCRKFMLINNNFDVVMFLVKVI